ncbi:MAG: hypothetical protein KGJ78_11170 [Alphaproteobacteria bacterium]|nr:hypothetical protein [Alphaproteobacteria bacterium]
MRRILISSVVGLLVLSTVAASADQSWKGPGWYIADVNGELWEGPYNTKDDCERALPQVARDGNINIDLLYCDHFDTEPASQ